MRFWDASAIVPLLVDEPSRGALLQLIEQDPVMIVWWGTPVECVSAIASREREALLALEEATAAIARLRALASAWQEVLATAPIRNTAQRLLRPTPCAPQTASSSRRRSWQQSSSRLRWNSSASTIA